MSPSPLPLIECRALSRHFGGIAALDDVSLQLGAGEVLGLLGHNGAGKSTLIKLLAGALLPSSGMILLEGRPVTLANPRAARRLGIETIYQTLALADNLDAAANLFLGRELLTRWGFLDHAGMQAAAASVLRRLNPNFPLHPVPVRALSGGQRQAVALARALYFKARILILDEPTAALGPAETAEIGAVIAALKADGIGIILISHDLDQVCTLSDRVAVLKNGRMIATCRTDSVSKESLLRLIIRGEG